MNHSLPSIIIIHSNTNTPNTMMLMLINESERACECVYIAGELLDRQRKVTEFGDIITSNPSQ